MNIFILMSGRALSSLARFHFSFFGEVRTVIYVVFVYSARIIYLRKESLSDVLAPLKGELARAKRVTEGSPLA